MLLEIGKIPYTDKDAPGPSAGRHKPVYIRKDGNKFSLQVEGLNQVELPNPCYSQKEAEYRAKKFIRRNKGTALKRVRYKLNRGLKGWPKDMRNPVTAPQPYSERKKKPRKKDSSEATPAA